MTSLFSNTTVLVLALLLAPMALVADDHAHPHPERLHFDDAVGLHNIVRLTPMLITGGEPAHPHSLTVLHNIGVKTVISVDGARPDVEAAATAGLQYVHIPIGYDQITSSNVASLAKALRTRPGPFYIHCHHGLHRGPAMAAVARRIQEKISAEEAESILTFCRTGREYAGLWRGAAHATADEAAVSNALVVSVAPVGDLQAAMSALDRTWDHLKDCSTSGWRAPPQHPDITPVHEALMLWEGLAEARRICADSKPASFADMMNASVEGAKSLHTALTVTNLAQASASFEGVRQSCRDCHNKHRN